uniref:Uncharacterized protein n=1 Tax=Rhizophora mucronata TaxID=61149 RepID=A0A2P2MV90_RHIMU
MCQSNQTHYWETLLDLKAEREESICFYAIFLSIYTRCFCKKIKSNYLKPALKSLLS